MDNATKMFRSLIVRKNLKRNNSDLLPAPNLHAFKNHVRAVQCIINLSCLPDCDACPGDWDRMIVSDAAFLRHCVSVWVEFIEAKVGQIHEGTYHHPSLSSRDKVIMMDDEPMMCSGNKSFI